MNTIETELPAKRFSLYVDPQTLIKVKQMARKNRLSANQLILMFIDGGLSTLEKGQLADVIKKDIVTSVCSCSE